MEYNTIIQPRQTSFIDYIASLYNTNGRNIRNITFQVTNDCCCACSYCYEINKSKDYMSFDTGKQIIDLLFNMYKENDEKAYINQTTQGFIFDFIGGEPFMNIEVISQICTYFFDKCILENPDWLMYWKISIISNGALYFTEAVQKFILQFKPFLDLQISLDGPEDVHNACRVYHNGTGNFKDAFKAFQDLRTRFPNSGGGTKITISPNNLNKLYDIVVFFLNLGLDFIPANCILEYQWTNKEAKIYYFQLKQIADLLINKKDLINFSLFRDYFYHPMPETDNVYFCGGMGAMLAFAPDGIAYPCLRFMPSSLGNNIKPIIIGNAKNGIYQTEQEKEYKKIFDQANRKSISTQKCYNCPIASGCPYCAAWNYQSSGHLLHRNTNICVMHKAASLANVYFWNNFYEKHNSKQKFKMFLPKEDALEIIDENEYNMLKNLQN